MSRRPWFKPHRTGTIAVVLYALWLAACPKDRQVNFKSELNVFCVLNPRGAEFWGRMVIERTYAIDEEAVYDLEDALVVVSDSVHSETLSYAFDNQFHLPQSIGYDTTQKNLRLMVAAEGLDTLWGATTIPGDFQVLSPAPQDTFGPEDTLVLTKSRGALMYAFCWGNGYGSGALFYFPDYLTDSIIEIPMAWMVEAEDPPGEYSFEVAAYDSNYAEYKMHWETNTYPRYGVTGGLGVFGSAYTKRVFFYYRP